MVRWTTAVPAVAALVMAVTFGSKPGTPVLISVLVGALTVLPGRATVQEGGVHLVLFLAFVFLALNP